MNDTVTLFSIPQNKLQIPLKLRWRKGRDMPWGITQYPKTVQLRDNLYMGGGVSIRTNTSADCTVLVYSESNGWTKLPEYQFYCFGMTIFHDQLTLVGGRKRDTHNVTNQLGVWNPSSKLWTQPYPPMTTYRYSSEVATYNNYLLAAGGHNGRWELTTVELLDVRASKQWLTATQLPVPCCSITSAILHDTWYVIADSGQVICTSLPYFTQTVSKFTTNTTTTPWVRLPDTPLKHSTAIALGGSLLAVGGCHDHQNIWRNISTTDIHLYHPESNTWSNIGDLPTPREYCSVTLLPRGEFLVAGGHDGKRYPTHIDVATILLH